MPIYEYQCEKCDYRFELKQKFSDEPANECPKCGGALKKLISQTAFALKGNGWYAEGYSNKTEKKPTPCSSGGSCGSCPSAT